MAHATRENSAFLDKEILTFKISFLSKSPAAMMIKKTMQKIINVLCESPKSVAQVACYNDSSKLNEKNKSEFKANYVLVIVNLQLVSKSVALQSAVPDPWTLTQQRMFKSLNATRKQEASNKYNVTLVSTLAIVWTTKASSFLERESEEVGKWSTVPIQDLAADLCAECYAPMVSCLMTVAVKFANVEMSAKE